MRWLLLITLLLPMSKSIGQPYHEGGKTRHRFAQLNLGTDLLLLPPSGTGVYQKTDNGAFLKEEMKTVIQNRITIGGTHFWGKADFYIAIPILQLENKNYRYGVETGGKYFFNRITHKQLSPYLGAAMLYHNYQAEGGGNREKMIFPVLGGLCYSRGRFLADFGLSYSFHKEIDYYYEETRNLPVKTPALALRLGVKWMLETTVSAEKNWKSGKTQLLTDTLAKLKRLDGVTIAVGPSAAFFTTKSTRTQLARPFLYQHQSTKVFLDLGLGYYLHRKDFQLNLSLRMNESEKTGFGYHQTLVRKSLGVEGFKFLGDYHGFVPFWGPMISYEQLEFEENLNGKQVEFKTTSLLRPGIIFGWDIRPDRLQAILLRTNLRWVPNLRLPCNTGSMRLDQLEFNFIQVVIFPQRWMGYR